MKMYEWSLNNVFLQNRKCARRGCNGTPGTGCYCTGIDKGEQTVIFCAVLNCSSRKHPRFKFVHILLWMIYDAALLQYYVPSIVLIIFKSPEILYSRGVFWKTRFCSSKVICVTLDLFSFRQPQQHEFPVWQTDNDTARMIKSRARAYQI